MYLYHNDEAEMVSFVSDSVEVFQGNLLNEKWGIQC